MGTTESFPPQPRTSLPSVATPDNQSQAENFKSGALNLRLKLPVYGESLSSVVGGRAQQTGKQEALGCRGLGHYLLSQSVQPTHGTVDDLLLRGIG